VQVVLEVADANGAKIVEDALRAKYDNILVAPYGINN
jgi:hypothetical protein